MLGTDEYYFPSQTGNQGRSWSTNYGASDSTCTCKIVFLTQHGTKPHLFLYQRSRYLQNGLSSVVEVGMVIGLVQCQQDPCRPPSDQLGSIVFNGQFFPRFHGTSSPYPYDNFTVTVPTSWRPSFGTKKAQLATVRLSLIGVSGDEYDDDF